MKDKNAFWFTVFMILLIIILIFGIAYFYNRDTENNELCIANGYDGTPSFFYGAGTSSVPATKANKGYVLCFTKVYKDNFFTGYEYAGVKKKE